MWSNDCEGACRTSPDLVAAYESPGGQLALLLRHTLVPLSEERAEWLAQTRAAARAIVSGLRAGGHAGSVLVLQWLSLDQVDAILRGWACRYDADPRRRLRLVEVAARFAADHRFLATRGGRGRASAGFSGSVEPVLALGAREAILQWYSAMGPCWAGMDPPVRRRLVLRVHRWLAERVLERVDTGEHEALADLGPDGPLAAALASAVPAAEIGAWVPWIRIVVADLGRALGWPAARRDDTWARWLFLIPYSVPVPGLARPRTAVPHPRKRPAAIPSAGA
jgi:hypothetical protein